MVFFLHQTPKGKVHVITSCYNYQVAITPLLVCCHSREITRQFESIKMLQLLKSKPPHHVQSYIFLLLIANAFDTQDSEPHDGHVAHVIKQSPGSIKHSAANHTMSGITLIVKVYTLISITVWSPATSAGNAYNVVCQIFPQAYLTAL